MLKSPHVKIDDLSLLYYSSKYTGRITHTVAYNHKKPMLANYAPNNNYDHRRRNAVV
jgi:hypothetical protein